MVTCSSHAGSFLYASASALDATLPAWMRGGTAAGDAGGRAVGPSSRGSSRSRSPPRNRSPPRGYENDRRRRSPSPRDRGHTDTAGYGSVFRSPASSVPSYQAPPPFNFGGGGGGLIDTKALIAAAMANAASSSQSGIVNPATRTARRLYVGGLPVTTEPLLVCVFRILPATSHSKL